MCTMHPVGAAVAGVAKREKLSPARMHGDGFQFADLRFELDSES